MFFSHPPCEEWLNLKIEKKKEGEKTYLSRHEKFAFPQPPHCFSSTFCIRYECQGHGKERASPSLGQARSKRSASASTYHVTAVAGRLFPRLLAHSTVLLKPSPFLSSRPLQSPCPLLLLQWQCLPLRLMTTTPMKFPIWFRRTMSTRRTTRSRSSMVAVGMMPAVSTVTKTSANAWLCVQRPRNTSTCYYKNRLGQGTRRRASSMPRR